MSPTIHAGYVPGVIGRITELHADYYSRHWGFGRFFEAKVASEMAAFVSRFDETRDGLWWVTNSGRIEGGIAIDGIHGDDAGAHLRWFILAEHLKGKDLGNRLIARALDFCRSAAYPSVYLWTFGGLHAARHLYEKHGFRLDHQEEGDQWGKTVTEQRFVLIN